MQDFQAIKNFEGISVYTLEIPGDDPSTREIEGDVNGDEIVFHIENQPADQTGTWASGADRELSLTTAQPPGWVTFLPMISR